MQAFSIAVFRIVVAMLLLSSTTTTQAQSKSSAEIGRGIAKAFGSDSSSIPNSDFNQMIEFREIQSQWNRAATPLVRDYLNPTLPRDKWVTETNSYVTELRTIYLHMLAATFSFQDPAVRNYFRKVVATYKAKLDGITHLHSSVAVADADGEHAALAEIDTAASDAMKIGNNLFDKLSPFMSAEEIKTLSDQTRRAISEIRPSR